MLSYGNIIGEYFFITSCGNSGKLNHKKISKKEKDYQNNS
jgi:hypothetical protein